MELDGLPMLTASLRRSELSCPGLQNQLSPPGLAGPVGPC